MPQMVRNNHNPHTFNQYNIGLRIISAATDSLCIIAFQILPILNINCRYVDSISIGVVQQNTQSEIIYILALLHCGSKHHKTLVVVNRSHLLQHSKTTIINHSPSQKSQKAYIISESLRCLILSFISTTANCLKEPYITIQVPEA